jgi:hypothetical protein
MKALFLLLALSAPALAGHADAIAGVYKHRFTNAIITPGKQPMQADTSYQAEDVLEIVPYGKRHIYFRTRLSFYNGHSCGLSGMAVEDGGKFIYRDRAPAIDGGPPCTLTLTPSADAISLTDRLTPDSHATCRAYCGQRGSLSAVSFKASARRPIRYLPRLLGSRQYKQAVAELNSGAAPLK